MILDISVRSSHFGRSAAQSAATCIGLLTQIEWDLFMPRLRVHSFTISLDGYGAGPNQGLDSPLAAGGVALHEWIFAIRTFRQMSAGDGGTTGIDDNFAARGFTNIGAWIMGERSGRCELHGPTRRPDKAR